MVHTKLRQSYMTLRGERSISLDLAPVSKQRAEALLLQDDPDFDPHVITDTSFDFLDSGTDIAHISSGHTLDSFSRSAAQELSDALNMSISSLYKRSESTMPKVPAGDLQLLGLLEEDEGENCADPMLLGQNLGFEFDKDGQIVELSPITQPSWSKDRNNKRSAHDTTNDDDDDIDDTTNSAVWKRPRVMPNILDPFAEEEERPFGLFEGFGNLSPTLQGTEQALAFGRHSALPADVPMLDFAEDNGPLETKSQSRKRKFKTIPLDSVTTMSSDMLKAWQANYVSNMRQLQASRSSQSTRATAKKNADLLSWAYGGTIVHPHLLALFCTSSRARLASSTENVTRAVFTRSAQRSSAKIDDPNVEVPMQDNIGFQDDVELGRRVTQEDHDIPSVQNSVFPWNVSREGSMLRSFSAIHGPGQDTLATQTTPRRFSFVPTPTLRSRQNSALPPTRQSGLGLLERLDSVDGPAPEEVVIDFFDDSELLNVSVDKVINESQLILQNMQQESLNFLEFTRTKLFDKAQESSNTVDHICFTEIVPPKSTTTFVAAQAFSHVLFLATQGLIRVEQESPYDDVKISDVL